MKINKWISVGLGAAALGGILMAGSISGAASCDGAIQTTWSRTSTCPNSFDPDGISQGLFAGPTGRQIMAVLSTSEPGRQARARGFNSAGTLRCTAADDTNNGDTNGDIRGCFADVSKHLVQVF
jgi:hypothetical protein